VEKFVKAGYEDTPEHRATIERVYRRECAMIAESSPVYRNLTDLEKQGGFTDEMICARLKISKPALEKVRKCLAVLDIDSIDRQKSDAAKVESVTDKEKTESLVAENDMAELTGRFDAQVTPMSKADADKFDKEVDERKAKARERNKKSRAKKTVSKKATKEEPSTEKTELPEVKLDLGDENLLSNIDLSAFENK
jgi:hypothetical protein